jgi:CHAT domain-containing protein/tetratricopeptide (TPR) repeat protein
MIHGMPRKLVQCPGALLIFLLAGSLLGTPAARLHAEDAEDTELLLPGQSRERPITAGETHLYRVEAADSPRLVMVEQRGIDLAVETGPGTTLDAPSGSWSPEVFLLAAGAGMDRLAVHPRQKLASPGRYVIRVEAAPDDERRRAALAAMSRGGQLAAGDSEARDQALAAYREAWEIWHGLGDHRWEAEALGAVATLEFDRADFPSAADGFLQTLALWRTLGEPRREAAVQRSFGQTQLKLGRLETARTELETARALWRRLGERAAEGETLCDLCLVEQTGGALPAALACYADARAIFRDLGSTSQEAQIANSLGGIYDLQGEPDAALDHYRQALALRQATGDRSGEAETLINLATVHRALGDWQEALHLYGQAQEIVAALGERLPEAFLFNNLGYLYDDLGEPQRALVFVDHALELRRQMGDRRGEAITLNNLGTAWRHLGDLDKALDHHRRALEIALASGDRRQEGITHLRLAETRLEREEPAAALTEIEPALALLRAMGLRRGEMQALHLRGLALARSGRPREALPVLQDVLAQRREARDRAGEAEALLALATVERTLGLTAEARAHSDAAVARVEELRSGFISPGLRASFLATRRRAYTLSIDLLMDRHAADPAGGYDRAALEMSERARARSLVDALDPASAGRTREAGLPPELIARRQALHRRLQAKINQQIARTGATEELGREIETLLVEIDGIEAEIRRRNPLYASFTAPAPIHAAEIAGLLDPGTVLLEYALGEERSFVWAVSQSSIRSVQLPPQKEIEELARRFYGDLSTVEAGAAPKTEAAEALGRVLLGPVWQDAAGLRRLVVVPDGALHSVPFSALLAPGARTRLVEQVEIVSIPSATTLALQRRRFAGRPPAPRRAAILADPVFSADDARLAHPSTAGRSDLLPRFERLPASRREAESISALAPRGQVLTALDFAASRETVLSGQLRDERIVHFATHGVADLRSPELSGLVLSLVDAAGRPQDGFLSLSDIYDLDLGADLVVLSGCRTALGKEVRGEGLMGLTRGFLYAGVPRVAASLWRVEDRTTAELLVRFYRALWQDNLPAAAALRQAQLALAREPRYKSPYSWAGFVLQGDWR